MLNRNAVIFFLLAIAVLSIGVVTILLFLKSDTPQEEAISISKNLSKEIKVIDEQANQLLSSNEEGIWEEMSYSFFLMDSASVIKWNKNEFLPDVRLMQDDFVLKTHIVSRGSFIIKKWKKDQGTFLLAVIPLFKKYSISNRYLFPLYTTKIFSGIEPEILDPLSLQGYPIIVDGNVLFKVKYKVGAFDQHSYRNLVALVSGWMALLLFVIALYFVIDRLHLARRFEWAFLVLAFGLILMRVLMINYNFPRDFSSLYIFDPLQFASSSLNPSIADLLFNTIAVLVIGTYLFFSYYKWHLVRKVNVMSGVTRFCYSVLSLVVCLYTILFPFLFFETISHNSNISLDISQTISFDLIRILALLSVLLGSASAFLFCHVFFKCAIFFTGNSRLQFYLSLSSAAFIFFLTYTFSAKDYFITLASGLVYFLVLFSVGLNTHIKRFSYATFLYFFLFIIILAVQGSFTVKGLVEERTKEDQFKYGNNFLVDRDILGEYLLHEMVKRISDDPFVQSRMSTPFLSKSAVRQKIDQLYLNAYFDRYDVKIYLYNASGESHDDFAKENFASLIKAFQKEANKTNYEGIYFIESPNQEFAKRYLAIVPVRQRGPSGFVVLDLSLKKLIPQNVFPELLVDNQFINYFRNAKFSYAFFLRNKLISNSGVFNYEKNFNPNLLDDITLYRTGVVSNGFRHIAIEDDLGRVAVVSAATYTWFSIVANFSFQFVLGLSLILLLLILFALVLWIKGQRLNYAARIQTYVYLAFLLPLIAVSVTTLSLISNSEELELKTDFLTKSKIIGDRLGIDLNENLKNEEASASEFERQLLTLTRFANVDATVFSKEGKLIASSQPLIYQNQLVSVLIDREAWRRIAIEKESSFVKNETIGELNFNTSYSSLRSPDTGELIGILSIPFFDSLHSLEITQINVWENILVIFVFVFLLFSIVSFFIVNWLTFPLRFITKTLSKTTFSGENKSLDWKSSDEIGLLVTQYNRMLENLELSKIELSRIQKESAWREIAKQVAHEINNPLTPMKLTLQRMELAQAKGSFTKEETERSIKTLLTQVEILNQIASSFSAFARMPAPVLRKIDILFVLKKVVDLHTNSNSPSIYLKTVESIFIKGDEQLLVRVFSNVILNALQSTDNSRGVVIEIGTKIEGQFCVTSIADNGSGIDDELKDKVFLPHFSTKKTGSGIGLAIAKQGIELSGGEIWFESKVGVGTTFFIKLPLFL